MMTMTQIEFEIVRMVPLILSAIGQLIFVVVYALPSLGAGKWWKSQTGRALFIKSSTLALLLLSLCLSFLSRWVNGEYTGITWQITKYEGNLEYLIVFGYWAVAFGVYYQMWALVRQRYLARMKKRVVRYAS